MNSAARGGRSWYCALFINRRCAVHNPECILIADIGALSVRFCAVGEVSAMRPMVSWRSGEQSCETYVFQISDSASNMVHAAECAYTALFRGARLLRMDTASLCGSLSAPLEGTVNSATFLIHRWCRCLVSHAQGEYYEAKLLRASSAIRYGPEGSVYSAAGRYATVGRTGTKSTTQGVFHCQGLGSTLA